MPVSNRDNRVAILPLALLCTGLTAYATTALWTGASSRMPRREQAVSVVQMGLDSAGFTWAHATIEEDGIVISGQAGNDSERVLAYHIARRSLLSLGTTAAGETILSRISAPPNAGTAESAGVIPPSLDTAAILPPPMPQVHAHAVASLPAPAPQDKHPVEPPTQVSHNEETPPPEPVVEHKAAVDAAPPEQLTPAAVEERVASLTPTAAATPAPEQPGIASPAPAEQHEAPKPALTVASDCRAEFNKAFAAQTILFENDSATIDKRSRPLLDTLARIAKRCAKFNLVVQGHADRTGTRVHNEALSRTRAEAVRWALIDRGVDMDHISAEAYGYSRPADAAATGEAMAKNRRIEFSVLEPKAHQAKAAQK